MGDAAFTLVAGHVALDLVNTLDDRFVPETTVDRLGTYGDLLRFCEQAKVIEPREARDLRQYSASRHANAALGQGKELRETLFRIFTAVATHRKPAPEDLAALNEHVARALSHRRLQPSGGKFRWSWEFDADLEAPLWPIALSAADLLVSSDLDYVRECGADTCRWLFLDLSKNHRRRWCDMKTCGNRAKARQYYRNHTAP